MKTLLKAVGMLAIAAGTASADIRLDLPSNHVMLPASAVEAIALDSGATSRGTPVYSSIPGPYSALANGAFAQRDDYVSVHPATGSGNFIMDAFKFAGGVTAVGGILDIFFLDAGLNVVSSFGVTLNTAGDFIWTITPTVPAPAAIGGFMQIQTRTGTTGRWFATSHGCGPRLQQLRLRPRQHVQLRSEDRFVRAPGSPRPRRGSPPRPWWPRRHPSSSLIRTQHEPRAEQIRKFITVGPASRRADLLFVTDPQTT
jgi:hypothetical protein